MKLLYYCWDGDGMTGSFPQIFDEKPANVEVDETRGVWRFITDDKNDSGFGKEFPIGGKDGDGSCREVSAPFGRFTKGCITVLDQENFEHIVRLEAIAFSYGNLLQKLQHPR